MAQTRTQTVLKVAIFGLGAYTTLSDSERSFAAGLAYPGERIDAGGRSPHASVQGV